MTLQKTLDEHPTVAKPIVNFTGGALKANLITGNRFMVDLLDLEAHGVDQASCWFGLGQEWMGVVEPGPKGKGTPGGRNYTPHFRTRWGEARNHRIPGRVIDSVIDNTSGASAGGGKYVHYNPVENIMVVTIEDGTSIISAHPGRPNSK